MPERIVNFSNAIDKGRVLTYIRNLTGEYNVKIERKRKTRSLKQNAYIWGVVVPHVAAGLQEAWGETLSDDETYEFLKERFLAKPVYNKTTGEKMGTTRPSGAKLDTAEFTYWIEQVMEFAASYLGVAIPEPGQELVGAAKN